MEPNQFKDAAKDQRWMVAMKEEIRMIEKNQTWVLVDRLEDRKIIDVKWVFKTKYNLVGSINKLKARLEVKGFA